MQKTVIDKINFLSKKRGVDYYLCSGDNCWQIVYKSYDGYTEVEKETETLAQLDTWLDKKLSCSFY